MKQKKQEALLIKLDEFISNLDNSDNDMANLIYEANILEKEILEHRKEINSTYIDTIINLKSILINIKENQDTVKLLKNITGNNKKLSQKMLLKLQEKGIDVKNIASEIKNNVIKLEKICKDYNNYRENEKRQAIVSKNYQSSKKLITKLNIRAASFVLAAVTAISTIGYVTFKLLNKDDKKAKYEVSNELEDIEIENDYYAEIMKMDEPIIAKTTVVKSEPIISTLPNKNLEVDVIVLDDFENYPKLNCDNKHVYYRFAKSYTFTDEELNILMKVVTKEAAANNSKLSYDELYVEVMAVTSTILNRFEDKEYYKSHGTNLIEHLSAPSQFTTYQGALKMKDSAVPDVVKDAVTDTLNGVRNHEFIEFRANPNKGLGRTLITKYGNNYFHVMNPIEEVKEIEYVKNK